MQRSVVMGWRLAVSRTPNARTYDWRPSCQIPTMASGTDARSMAAGIALSNAAARSSAALDALHPVRSPVASVALTATVRIGRNARLLFILAPQENFGYYMFISDKGQLPVGIQTSRVSDVRKWHFSDFKQRPSMSASEPFLEVRIIKRIFCATAMGLTVLASAARTETAVEALKRPLPPVLDPAAIDQSADPCVDFYQYSCGAWLKATPIPPDEQIWWRASELDEHTRAVLAAILEEADASPGPKTRNRRKIGDYYASCLDQAEIDAKGLRPFTPELERIAAIKDKKGLAGAVARLHLLGTTPLFSFSSAQDYMDSTMMIASTDQAGFALPDRDYYLTDEFKAERADYRAHLARMFGLLGDDTNKAKAEAEAVMRVETALAKAATGIVERREPKNVHHKMTLTEFIKLTPTFDWTAYLVGVGAPTFTSLDVADTRFFKRLEASLKSVPVTDWKAYLRWTFIHGLILSTPKAFVDEDFAFFDKRLGGQVKIKARWKRCVDATDEQLGHALGEAYIAREFSPEAKQRVLAMTRQITKEMEANIKTLDWMSDETKARALEKLASVTFKIAHPDNWLDYSTLEIVRGDALGNRARASSFELRRQLSKIGKPVDRREWSMTPPTNDASYDLQMNNIEVPAGILRPPNFDLKADDATNYGNLGALIGHELTHGFDDEGRHYDARGNLRDWWTKEDAKAFKARASDLIRQYGGFVAVKDSADLAKNIRVDGELTLGENTADNGGIRLSYEAFLSTVAAKAGNDSLGYTPTQRFFLSYAQGWCTNRTDEFAKEAAKTDPHSPGKYRVNGVLMNMPPFRAAFACKAGTPMAPTKLHRVW
jgi:putative endopeptidase